MKQMRLSSINTTDIAPSDDATETIESGIDKHSRAGAVAVTELGLQGDVVVDGEHHGGPDQAIYAYSLDDYRWWEQQLGKSLEPGTFGDNLTIEGMPTDMNVGDRLLIGEVVLEATAPRIPCATLSRQMRDSGFALRFRRAERPGIYFRVLNEGDVSAGDEVTFVADSSASVSISDLVRAYYDLSPDRNELRRLLDAPIATRLRAKFEAKLAS
jgi:MOSC domain-containing protein YiiM